MKFSVLLEKSNSIKSQINDLRTEAYTEHKFKFGDSEYAFYASFDIDRGTLVYNIVRDGFEVKLLADLPNAVFQNYAVFIKAHDDWEQGFSERPVFKSR